MSDEAALTARARALKAAGRMDEALGLYAAAARAAPASGAAEHNLAANLGNTERYAEAAAAAERAVAKGHDAPETWLIRGRALEGLGDLDAAETAFRQALRRRPDDVDAHRNLAQLMWSKTADADRALEALDGAIVAFPRQPMLRLVKARLEAWVGRPAKAHRDLTALAEAAGNQPMAWMEAARGGLAVDPDLALRQAARACELAPGDLGAACVMVEALLAVGQSTTAAALIEPVMAKVPDDQGVVALAATVWRLVGDPRYATLYDYDAVVGVEAIDTPPGWSGLDAYLADLVPALDRLHVAKTHPIGQSVRGGSQTKQSLLRSDDPVIRAFFTAIDGPIRRHLARLGPGSDPVRRRNRGGYRVAAAWSVNLTADGHHVDHVHPEGWLSSACHIAIPTAVDGEDHAGWLKFGQSGTPTLPALPAERFVRPRPGWVALFPSYMWHGTVPFTGTDRRLSVAFDLVPADA